MKGAPDSGGGALHGIKLHLVIVRVQQPVQLGAAGFHPFRHFAFTDALLGHGLFDLPYQDVLDSVGGCFLADAFIL